MLSVIYLPDDFVTLHRPTKVTAVVVRFSCARAVLSIMPTLPRNERNYVSLYRPRKWFKTSRWRVSRCARTYATQPPLPVLRCCVNPWLRVSYINGITGNSVPHSSTMWYCTTSWYHIIFIDWSSRVGYDSCICDIILRVNKVFWRTRLSDIFVLAKNSFLEWPHVLGLIERDLSGTPPPSESESEDKKWAYYSFDEKSSQKQWMWLRKSRNI